MRYLKANESGTMLYDTEDNMKLVLAHEVGVNSSNLDLASRESEKKISDAIKYLSDTDWYAIREFETGIKTPSDVKIKRSEARVISDNYSK